MKTKEYSTEIAGRTLTAIFSDLADQAHGSVIVRYGQTVVMATAVMSPAKREGIDFFPLVVDYEEKFYAAGKILGGQFMKREGKPSDEAILTGRVIDRTIRPFFDQRIRNEVQVVVTTLSIDDENDTDVPAVVAASLALATSDIPWSGPLSAVRIGEANSELVINPSYKKLNELTLDLLVCGKERRIAMIEAEGKEVKENKIAEAFELALAEIEKLQNFQQQIISEIGKTKRKVEIEVEPTGMAELFAERVAPKLEAVVFSGKPGKETMHSLEEEWQQLFAEALPEANPSFAARYLDEKINDAIHRGALEAGKRADGRGLNELRPLFAQAGGISDIIHGAGIFFRGGTHILSVLTLGGPKDAQVLDGMEVRGEKYFMHHYNFPPFSTGETGRMGGTSRRSVGHGALAEKSLRGILPSRDEFPYTIRIVSEALASNGSTSMGSVCASTLALMDGGVPIKRPAAGIAIGLMCEEEKMLAGEKFDYKILTDIQGPEDHHGDMDFKVAGTSEGVTGIQLDIKVGGIPKNILVEALEKARVARLQILDVITSAIVAPRAQLRPAAPKITQLHIPVDKIGSVIGPGGKVIQKICAETGAEISIEDDGTVVISGAQAGVAAARTAVEDITREYKAGDRFMGEVTRLMDFGAFVKIGRDAEGLVHISEMAPFRVEKVTDLVQLGETVPVVVKERDERGRLNLSIKSADPDFAKKKGLSYNKPNESGRNEASRDPNPGQQS